MSASNGVAVDATIGDFYDAAVGRLPWERAMHEVAGHLGLIVAQVIGVDVRDRRVLFSFEGGTGSAEATLDYTRTYHRVDPHVEHLVTLPVGDYVSFSEVLGSEVVEQHPFYRDYLIPYGGRHVHAAKLHETTSHVVLLGLHRGYGRAPLAGDEVVLARRLVSHLVRAFTIFMGLRTTFAEAAFGQALLDRLLSPVVLLDAQRRVVMSNVPARGLLGERCALSIDDGGRLRCRRASTDVELGLALKALQLSGHAGLEREPPAERKVLSIPLAGQLRPLVATLIALRPENSMGAFGAQPLAMMVLHDTNRPTALDAFVLAAAFDLTPAEARVATQLAAGLKPSQIAEVNGTSLSTANTHVRAIHAKLGVTRTAEAVAVLHSIPFAARDISDVIAGDPG